MKIQDFYCIFGREILKIDKLTGKIKPEVIRAFCEAQGKGRARGRPRKVTLRSFIFETSTSNPFLCAADFFLQLGSCKDAIRYLLGSCYVAVR